jgi:phage shock protein C
MWPLNSASGAQPSQAKPRLHRSATDSVIAGVCGGIAEYMQVDPSLVRLVFVIGTLWGGTGLVAYIALAIVLPIEQDAEAPATLTAERSRVLGGLVLIVLGSCLLVSTMGWFPWLSWNLLRPTVLILVGVGVLRATPSASDRG